MLWKVVDLQDIPIHDLNFCALCYGRLLTSKKFTSVTLTTLMYIMVGSIPTKIFASVTLTTKLYVIAACGSAGQAEGE